MQDFSFFFISKKLILNIWNIQIVAFYFTMILVQSNLHKKRWLIFIKDLKRTYYKYFISNMIYFTFK